MTQLITSGPPGTKRNLAVLGDGFTEADQATYNQKVRDLVTEGVFTRDYFYEDKQAYNVYRVNLVSNDSGVSQRTYDSNGNVTSSTNRDTALDFIYTGQWSRCWMEYGDDTVSRLQSALNTWVPDYDFVMVILNESRGGGCARGSTMAVTMGSGWATVAHELGHGFGRLADEYCRPGVHGGGEPWEVNVTANSNRSTLKWRDFVRPWTPVPTGVNPNANSGACTGYNQGTRPWWWDSDQDVGLFEGARYRDTGLYRPVENCRMRGNAPPFCPVCYTEMKRIHHPYTGRTFERVYAGDFNGDGKDDALVHNDNSIQLYRSTGTRLELVFSAVERVPGSWQFKPNDQFFVGDFDGDGADEVVVYNSTDWSMEYLGLLDDDGDDGLRLVARYDDRMPGWQFHRNDQFFVGDFDGNGKDDLVVFNGKNWSIPYLGMLRSSGSSFSLARRYDRTLAGWYMAEDDQYYVGDFSGDGRDDLVVFNGKNWSIPYLAMLRSDGGSVTMVRRYDRSLPGWAMAKEDRHYIGDFDGDGKDDIYVFNGTNWSMAYLGMLRSSGSTLSMTRRYDGSAPGWQMRKSDRHYLADVDGDGRADLFVYNHSDWSREYLGTMISTGGGLQCRWSEDWVGEWNLGSVDRFEPCNFEGSAGVRNLFVHNRNWFGMIRATPSLSLQRIYYRWIHNYRYGRNW